MDFENMECEFCGSLFSSEEDLIPVMSLDEHPFSEQVAIAYWRAGDIMAVLEEEGLLCREKWIASKIHSVMVQKCYVTDLETLDSQHTFQSSDLTIVTEYSVSYTIFANGATLGHNEKIEGMPAKIRDKKIGRII